jgi:hypothetical protein
MIDETLPTSMAVEAICTKIGITEVIKYSIILDNDESAISKDIADKNEINEEECKVKFIDLFYFSKLDQLRHSIAGAIHWRE